MDKDEFVAKPTAKNITTLNTFMEIFQQNALVIHNLAKDILNVS